MDDLEDLDLLRKQALESRSRKVRKKDYDYEEQLQLHPHEELEMSYNAAKKRAAKKRAAKRKSVKETSKKLEEQQEEKASPSSKAKEEDDPMIHFVNPHGGFMPYSTLSLAVKRTPDIGHVSPISSESPSPVNLYAKEEPPVMAAAPPAVKTVTQPPQPKQAPPPVKQAAVTKQTIAKPEKPVTKPVTKPVVAEQTKETVAKPEQVPKKVPVTKKPLSKPQRKDSHSRSSSSDSTSSFSSSSASSFSSNSSGSLHRKRRRRSSSSSSSSRSSSSVSSSSSSSSSSGSRRSSGSSRKRERRSKRHGSEQRRSARRRSVERNHDSHRTRNKIGHHDDDTDHWQNSRGHYGPQRGRGRGFQRPGNFQRDSRIYSDGGGRFHRNEPQDYQRDMRIQRPFNRPGFGRGRLGFNRDRPNFNSPQFRYTNFRGRGRDFRYQQQQRPFGLRHRLDSQPNYRSNERFIRRRDDGSRSRSRSPEHGRQHRRESVERHQSSRNERNSSHSRYDSKIGAPIKESRDHMERRPRTFSESNQSRYSDRSPERRPRSPVKSTDRVQSEEEDSEAELELQPESDLELAPPRREVNSRVHHSDSDHSGSNLSKTRSKVQQGRKRVTSSSSSSSSSGSGSSESSSEGTPERSRRINSPIRVSPERRDYKEKQGAAIHRKDHAEDSSTYHHPGRSQGHKRLHSDPDSSLDAVSKRLRPDLALRLGPDPELSTRASQHDDFVPTRQRRFYNNNSSATASQPKGNALEIARQFRLQKQKTTTKPAVVSKVAVSKVVKSVPTDNPILKPDDKIKETDPEKEKELSDRIRKIKEQNEKILRRQKEIEDDIELYA